MKLVSIFTILIFPLAVIAKNTIITFPTLYPHLGYGDMPNDMPPTNGGQYIRLTSSAKMIYDGSNYIPFDSTTYQYSAGRDGLLDQDYTDLFTNFDQSIYYEYDANNYVYNNVSRCTQTFNAAGTVQYRTQENWENDNAQWQNSFRYEYIYTEGYTQLLQTNVQIWNGSWNGNNLNYQIDYDINGNVIKVNLVTNIMYLTYDSNNNIIERKEYNWSQSDGWHFTDKYSFSYNVSNQLTGYILQHYNNGTWENYEQKEYTISNNNLASIITSTWNNGIWQPSFQNLFTYDINSNKLSDEYQVWDSVSSTYINQRKEFWTYNTENQPTSYYSQTWNQSNANWQPVKGDFYHHYYYEKYFPTDVSSVNSESSFALFPIPANNEININLNNNSFNGTKGYLSDMQGRILEGFTFTEKHKAIKTNNLPSGSYIINIISGNKKTAQPLSIVH